MDDSLEHATRMTYGNLATADTKHVMEKGHAKLMQPDVCAAVQSIYELRGFNMDDAVDLHIKHIRGELEKEVVTKVRDAEGNESVELTTIKIPPNYTALESYFNRVLPKQTTKVAVANFNMNQLAGEIEDEGYAPLEARIVGEVQNTDPPENPDDFIPYQDDEGDDDDNEGDDEEEESDDE